MMTREAAAWYLAGIIDGEGNIKNGKTRSTHDRRVRIRVCDKEIIDTCIEAAELLDLHYKVYWDTKQPNPKHSDYHGIEFSGQETLQKIYDTVPMQITSKKTKLKETIDSFTNKWYVPSNKVERLIDDLVANGHTSL